MKTARVLAAMTAAVIGAFGLVGCANDLAKPAATASNATAGQRTYTSDDLGRTGKRTSAEQLQAADPAVSTQGH